MKYSQLDNLQVLFLHTKKGFLPNVIRAFTGNYFNHTGSILKRGGEIYVFEATARGAVLTPFDEYIQGVKSGKYEIAIGIPEFKHDDCTKRRWLDYVNDNMYKVPYDKENLLINQPVSIISKWLGKEIWIGKTGEKANSEQICNELTYNHNWYTYLFGIPNIGYKARTVDIIQYFEYDNLITKNNIENFLN